MSNAAWAQRRESVIQRECHRGDSTYSRLKVSRGVFRVDQEEHVSSQRDHMGKVTDVYETALCILGITKGTVWLDRNVQLSEGWEQDKISTINLLSITQSTFIYWAGYDLGAGKLKYTKASLCPREIYILVLTKLQNDGTEMSEIWSHHHFISTVHPVFEIRKWRHRDFFFFYPTVLN